MPTASSSILLNPCRTWNNKHVIYWNRIIVDNYLTSQLDSRRNFPGRISSSANQWSSQDYWGTKYDSMMHKRWAVENISLMKISVSCWHTHSRDRFCNVNINNSTSTGYYFYFQQVIFFFLNKAAATSSDPMIFFLIHNSNIGNFQGIEARQDMKE